MSEASTFTGEFFIPGRSGGRLEEDHLARYLHVEGRVAGRTVLDIACGSGYGSRLLAAAGATSVTGVDISSDALAVARAGEPAPNLTFVQGDITTFGETDGAEVITCFETIEHVPDPWAALANLRRVLKPGGTLFISSPNRRITSPRAATLHDTPSNEFHIHEFTPDELVGSVADAGFSVDPTVLGQRRQPRLPRHASYAWGRAFDPKQRASAEPRPIRPLTTARYFVLTAH